MFRRADVVYCVYPVAVLNAAFCMTCSLLILVVDARGDHVDLQFFLASRPCGPAGWLALVLTNSGDVEINLGLTTSNK